MARTMNMTNNLKKAYEEQKWTNIASLMTLLASAVLMIQTRGLSIIGVIASIALAYRSSQNMNRYKSGLDGEKKVTSILKGLSDDFTVINNLNIKDSSSRVSEIDSLVIGKGQIYMIEVKNHRGFIEGEATDEKWQQSINYIDSRDFRNPIKQSTRQLYIIKDMLMNKGMNPFIKQIVVFANEKAVLDVNSDRIPVLKADQLLEFIESDSRFSRQNSCNEEQIVHALTA